MKSTKSALRLNPELVYEAELDARIQKRTTPKQIEYWAEIGKHEPEKLSYQAAALAAKLRSSLLIIISTNVH